MGDTKLLSQLAADIAQRHRLEERARVVAWLREWASVGRCNSYYDLADEIERGEHEHARWAGSIAAPGHVEETTK